MRMNVMQAALVGLWMAALIPSVSAATFHVAAHGNNANPGTADRPFLTVQKGLDAAQPGDTVLVKAGLYRERVSFPRAGQEGKPITLQGEQGAIIDGGEAVTGWAPAPEVGPGVFKTNSVAYFPRITTWQNKFILSVHGDSVPRVRAGKDQTVFDWLKTPAENDGYGEPRYRIANWWDGTEMFVTQMDKVTYFRDRNGLDPKNDIAVAPDNSSVVRSDKKDFVIVRGLTLRTAEWGVRISGTDCIVEDNFIYACGKADVLVDGGGARNHIRNNLMTLNHVYADYGHPWKLPVTNRIWSLIKSVGFGDEMAVRLDGHGDYNEVYGNFVTRRFDGINQKNGGGYTKVYNNILLNMADDALAPEGTEKFSEWHDNLVVEGGNGCLTVYESEKKQYWYKVGPMFVYRNRFHFTQTDNQGGGIHFKNPFSGDMVIYFYHNTIVGNSHCVSVNGNWTKVPPSKNIFFFNNIFSSPTFYSDTWSPNRQYGVGYFDHNWVGGKDADYLVGKPTFGPNNVVAKDQSLWADRTRTDFRLADNSPAAGKGLDISRPFTLAEREHKALPGFTPGYYTGKAPDMGAIQTAQQPPVPAAPTGLTLARKDGVAVLTWKGDADNATHFIVERSADGKVFTPLARLAANVTSCADTASAAGKTFYRVCAINVKVGAWMSEYSEVVPQLP